MGLEGHLAAGVTHDSFTVGNLMHKASRHYDGVSVYYILSVNMHVKTRPRAHTYLHVAAR